MKISFGNVCIKAMSFSTIVLVLLTGCGKKSNPTPVNTETKTQLLTKASWRESRDQFKNQDGTTVEKTLTSFDRSFKDRRK